MLTISPLRANTDGNHRDGGTTTMETNFAIGGDDFPDFSGANLLDSIDFDDLFMGMHEGDVLPVLEMDPELFAEFSLSSGGDDNSFEVNNNSSTSMSIGNAVSPNSSDNYCEGTVTYVVHGDERATTDDISDGVRKVVKHVKASPNKGDLVSKSSEEAEIESKKYDLESEFGTTDEKEKKHKSSSNSKIVSNNHNLNNQGKRKTKVDWTPELHRRFVQAVEQLGVDKAVPSRILELMGIDCLTRHNIASHLQKYRSHRKHLLAREAEAASWTQKRQMYGVAVGGGKGGASISPWHPPTMGFAPMPPMHHHPLRPLHVWGHPTLDPQARVPMWPKHVVPSPPPLTPAWAPPPHPSQANPSFWHSPQHRRLAIPPVPGIPPHAMYRPEHGLPPPLAQHYGSRPPVDQHPSKESIDSALGDVLSKPWLPLPIGLKPPSMDSVMGELQRQGVPKIPPSGS